MDGTLIACDRVRANRPYYSAKHRCHGMNIQVIAGPEGTMPGRMHDLTAVRAWGILRELDKAGHLVKAIAGLQNYEAAQGMKRLRGGSSPQARGFVWLVALRRRRNHSSSIG